MEPATTMGNGDLVASDPMHPESTEKSVLLPWTSPSMGAQESSGDINDDPEQQRVTPLGYSVEEISAYRRGKRPEDRNLSRKVRKFYKKQDELISKMEHLHRLHSDNEDDDDDANGNGDDDGGGGTNKTVGETAKNKTKESEASKRKRISLYTKLSLAVNVFLLITKIIAAVISHSLSVVSSVVDSGVDLASSVILFWATHAIKRRDPFMYPQGRTRLEPIAIVILSVIMCSASIQVISESLQITIHDVKALREYPSNSSHYVHDINMTVWPISIMGTTIVLKFILFLLCSREKSETLNALAQDHRNDVFSNIVALICGIVGSIAKKNAEFPPHLVLLDSIGAIVISIYILFTWIRQANQQVKRLSGYTANPDFIKQITWIAFHHSPSILKIDTVRAFHFGTHFLVEVDIVLPEGMSLKEAHDIGEELQKKIERIQEVERAFVHLDYEFQHKASDEHKVV